MVLSRLLASQKCRENPERHSKLRERHPTRIREVGDKPYNVGILAEWFSFLFFLRSLAVARAIPSASCLAA
jgi:hypothetical protein